MSDKPTEIEKPETETFKLSEVLQGSQGEQTQHFFEIAPDIVRELTQQLILHKDIRVRERVRAQMKSIFGMILADTEYPLNSAPAATKEKSRFDEIL